MIYFNTSVRAACIALINYTAHESDWLAIPLDQDGSLLIAFVRKSCIRGTGYRRGADLFDRDGCASETAQIIRRIAHHRGSSTFDPGTTGCCRLIGAVEEVEYTDQEAWPD